MCPAEWYSWLSDIEVVHDDFLLDNINNDNTQDKYNTFSLFWLWVEVLDQQLTLASKAQIWHHEAYETAMNLDSKDGHWSNIFT